MPVHPASQALPHRWRWSNLLPMAEQAGRLVPVGRGGERRAIALANPGLGGRPFATPTLWARGVSTQRPDQLRAFAGHARLPYPLLSDEDGRLAAGLLLPTFRAGGVDRFKRLTLLVGPDAVVRAVQFPVTDPAGAVDEILDIVRRRSDVRSSDLPSS